MVMEKFFKYNVLGNDYILFDLIDTKTSLNTKKLFSRKLIKYLCNRHNIGADGILVVFENNNKLYYKIFNQDGTEAKFCVNGVRAVGHYLHHFKGYNANITIHLGHEKEKEKYVKIIVKKNKVKADLPFPIKMAKNKLQVNNYIFYKTFAPNPHILAILTDKKLFYKKNPFLEIFKDKLLEYHKKYNIHIILPIKENKIIMRFYEKGVGETLSCGSGMLSAKKVFEKLDILPINDRLYIYNINNKKASIKNYCLESTIDFIFSGTLNTKTL